MQSSSRLFDLCALQTAEVNYREHLLSQPDNLATRLSLAWCLFIQALHQSGHEAAIMYNGLAYEQALVPSVASDHMVAERRNAQSLLHDCLQQTYIVKHLSTNDEDRTGVERLQVLVELAGAQEPATYAEAESLRRQIELAWEIRHDADADFNRSR